MNWKTMRLAVKLPLTMAVLLMMMAGAAVIGLFQLNAAPDTSGIVGEIASSSNERTVGIDQINQAITQIDHVIQQNASLAQEPAAAMKTIGVLGLPNVIQYLTEFIVPQGERHQYAQFEAVTGYMPREFDTFWTLDVKNGTAPTALRPLPAIPAGEQPLPVITSTSDRQYAMGVYCPHLPQPGGYARAGYGRFQFPNVVKWNAVFRLDAPPRENHFECYLAVGDLETVRRSLIALHHLIPG